MTVLVPFWQLRRAAVAEEAVRGGSRRPRLDGSWVLAPEVRTRLTPMLAGYGFDPSGEILVEERAGEDGFRMSQ